MLSDPFTDMQQSAKHMLMSAESVQKEFDIMLSMRPGLVEYFVFIALWKLKLGADDLDARSIIADMGAFSRKFYEDGVLKTKKRVNVDNRFSQHMADAAIAMCKKLEPYFERRPEREKPFKVVNRFSKKWA